MTLKEIFNLIKGESGGSDDIIKQVEKETRDLKPIGLKPLPKKPKETYDKDGNLIIQSKIND